MKQNRKIILATIVSAVVIAVGYFAYESLTFVTTDNAQVGGHITMLSSRVGGTITQVMVEENEKVKAGQVLAQIDISDFSSESQAAEAQVASLQARLREAEINYRRSNELYSKQAIAKERFDNATASYKELSARLKAAEAQRDVANNNVGYTKIVAPSDGAIARKSIEPGQFVPVGQPLFGFVSSNARWINANLKETELPSVKLGSTASITVDSLPGKHFVGTVESVSPSTGAVFSLLPPDNSTGNFTKVVQRVPVRIKLDNLTDVERDLLKPGLSAVVAIRIR